MAAQVDISHREASFNGTSYVQLLLAQPLALRNSQIGLSFKSCKGGTLFKQEPRAGVPGLSLEVQNSHLLLGQRFHFRNGLLSGSIWWSSVDADQRGRCQKRDNFALYKTVGQQVAYGWDCRQTWKCHTLIAWTRRGRAIYFVLFYFNLLISIFKRLIGGKANLWLWVKQEYFIV